MLGALILACAVSAGMIMLGVGLMLLAFFAEANTPIPGKAEVWPGGMRAGVILFAMGVALLALTLWPDTADAHGLAGALAAASI